MAATRHGKVGIYTILTWVNERNAVTLQKADEWNFGPVQFHLEPDEVRTLIIELNERRGEIAKRLSSEEVDAMIFLLDEAYDNLLTGEVLDQ